MQQLSGVLRMRIDQVLPIAGSDQRFRAIRPQAPCISRDRAPERAREGAHHKEREALAGGGADTARPRLANSCRRRRISCYEARAPLVRLEA